MEVVIRPVNDRFLREVAFPAFELGVMDATSGLQALQTAIVDDRTRMLIDNLLERGVEGSFFSLEESTWIETVYRLLFWEWTRSVEGWVVSSEYVGFAGDWETSLHLALMLEDPSYPYHDEKEAERVRHDFARMPDIGCGLSAMICGAWDPFPAFPPDQVLVTHARDVSYRRDDEQAIADWSWRPLHQVNRWGAQLPNKLSRLLNRETHRLSPVEAPETHEILDYWLGRAGRPPTLAVAFSGLGQESSTWIGEIGSLARQVRAAAALEQGLTAIITRRGRSMFDGDAREE
jgi:hypothetical protein